MNRYIETKVTDSGSEPLTLEQVKTFVTVTTTDYDDLLTDLITIARKKVERYTFVSLRNKTVVHTAELCEPTILPYPKIATITSVEYLEGQLANGTNTWETLTGYDYQLLGEDVKTFYPPFAGYYRITYTTTASTDADLLLTVKMAVNWLFRNRGDESGTLPQSILDNAKPLKIYIWG